jgi:hypothetical protein
MESKREEGDYKNLRVSDTDIEQAFIWLDRALSGALTPDLVQQLLLMLGIPKLDTFPDLQQSNLSLDQVKQLVYDQHALIQQGIASELRILEQCFPHGATLDDLLHLFRVFKRSEQEMQALEERAKDIGISSLQQLISIDELKAMILL